MEQMIRINPIIAVYILIFLSSNIMIRNGKHYKKFNRNCGVKQYR